VNSGNIIIQIFGDSTSGKTTAAQLATSTAGKASIRENTLMMNWNSTANAIMGFLRGNMGLPVLIDESSMAQITNFSNLIYTLEAGKEKSRMNKELNIREAASWLTTIISTGEHSLTSKSDQNTGIKIRVQEFGNVAWTKSADNSNNIKSCIENNYGHAAPELAEYLLKIGKEEVKKTWEVWYKRCLETVTTLDEFSQRIAIKQAVIMTTAEIAVKALDIPLDIEKILVFLIRTEEDGREVRDIAKSALELVIEQANINDSKFTKLRMYLGSTNETMETRESSAEGLEIWGKKEEIQEITLKDGSKCKQRLVITKDKFEKILKDGGYLESKVIFKKWKQSGVLDCEKDRLTRTRKIVDSGNAIPVYVINIANTEDEREKEPRRILPSRAVIDLNSRKTVIKTTEDFKKIFAD